MRAKADDDLILIAYDTSAWTRADIGEFTRRWAAEMAWECRVPDIFSDLSSV